MEEVVEEKDAVVEPAEEEEEVFNGGDSHENGLNGVDENGVDGEEKTSDVEEEVAVIKKRLDSLEKDNSDLKDTVSALKNKFEDDASPVKNTGARKSSGGSDIVPSSVPIKDLRSMFERN